jgi:hypothetical protein
LKEDEIDGVCSTNVECYWWESQTDIGLWEDQDIGGWIMGIGGIIWGGVVWTRVIWFKTGIGKWLCVPQNAGVAAQLVVYQEGFYSMELVS